MDERRGGRVRRGLAKAALLAASVLLGLVIAEVVLRLWLPDFHAYYVHSPNRTLEFDPSASIMPGIEGRVRFHVQSDGVRGDERTRDDTYRILAVGGSTTQCIYLDHDEAWPYRVQEMLNRDFGPDQRVWVGNAGRPGRRTREHILQLEYLLPQFGDIDAVVMLLGCNDAMRRLAEDASYDPMALDRPGGRDKFLRSAFEVIPSDPWRLSLRDTAIERLVRKLVTRARNRTQVLDRQGEAIRRWRLYRQRTPQLRQWMPDLGPALDEYARNLERLTEIAGRNGARIIFLTQPSMYREDLPQEYRDLLWGGGVGDYNLSPGHPYYSVEVMAKIFDAYNRVMLDSCEERGLECIDVASHVPRDTRAFYDDVHFNENGAEIVATLIVDHLGQRPPFAD